MDFTKGIIKDKRTYACVFVDLGVLLLLALPLVLVKTHLVEPADRLFYCDDVTISLPAKKEQFPTWLVYVLGLAIPMSTIVIVEIQAVKRVLLKATADSKDINEVMDKSRDLVSNILHDRLTRTLIAFKFGFLLTDALDWIAALNVGQLQPSFLSYCRPNLTGDACTTGLVSVSACTNNGVEVNDHRLAYWSENAAISMYSMAFLIMYLQARWPWGDPLLVRPLMQLLALVLAQMISLSQVADNEHDFREIVVGWGFGGAIALLSVVFISGLLDAKSSPDRPAKVPRLRRGEVYTLDGAGAVKTSLDHLNFY